MITTTIKSSTVIVTYFAILTIVGLISLSSAYAQSAESNYMAHYTSSGEMTLPENNMWRTWVFIGAPGTPNALNDGTASFPEYHNVYMQPWAYEMYKKTHGDNHGQRVAAHLAPSRI